MAQEISVITTALAIYGAALSSIVAAWNIYWQATDRGRLRVSVTLAEIVDPNTGTVMRNRLWYKVTNVGRQLFG
jgi:hypothetical protein